MTRLSGIKFPILSTPPCNYGKEATSNRRWQVLLHHLFQLINGHVVVSGMQRDTAHVQTSGVSFTIGTAPVGNQLTKERSCEPLLPAVLRHDPGLLVLRMLIR